MCLRSVKEVRPQGNPLGPKLREQINTENQNLLDQQPRAGRSLWAGTTGVSYMNSLSINVHKYKTKKFQSNPHWGGDGAQRG